MIHWWVLCNRPADIPLVIVASVRFCGISLPNCFRKDATEKGETTIESLLYCQSIGRLPGADPGFTKPNVPKRKEEASTCYCDHFPLKTARKEKENWTNGKSLAPSSIRHWSPPHMGTDRQTCAKTLPSLVLRTWAVTRPDLHKISKTFCLRFQTRENQQREILCEQKHW